MLVVSDAPVELGIGDAKLPSVSLGLGSPSAVAARVAEDPVWVHDEALRLGLEVRIPAGLIEHAGENLREVFGVGIVGFEVQGAPDARLVSGGSRTWYRLIFRTVRFRPSRVIPTRRLSTMSVPSSTCLSLRKPWIILGSQRCRTGTPAVAGRAWRRSRSFNECCQPRFSEQVDQ